MLKDSYEEAKRLLSENREIMDKIAEFLIEKETITGKEFMKIYRAAKGIPEPEEEEKENPESAEETVADDSKETEFEEVLEAAKENLEETVEE